MNKIKQITDLTDKELVKFWTKVAITADTDRCWNWLGASHKQGYGIITHRGKPFGAHRVSYFIRFNNINDNLHCLHKCDNPKCVNPNHLFLGTHQDNVSDREKKGRNNPPKGDKHWVRLHPEKIKRGEDSRNSKLNTSQDLQIRELYDKNIYSQRLLAKKFGVGQYCIARIVTRKSWRHI